MIAGNRYPILRFFLFAKQVYQEKPISAGDVSIKEIGNHLGFLEASHFSNYFKKHSGKSPAAYRKSFIR
ncbi:helix-turn-helix domain-containing protein [Sinomicrobium pectinilyticum]|uniref:helix-turn-helix domain-containing protein n=1 Tax=Sinomicrobium pectinilyticum TaxID=1084421 RepID=UPI001F0B986E|nr:helix-turn-helix domain-containing protein [Sinomicrobium pectinilyticum]